jgi:hypothetical protein
VGTPVRDIADMASGMEEAETSTEASTDPANKDYHLEVSLGWRSATAEMPEAVRTGDACDLLRTFTRERSKSGLE